MKPTLLWLAFVCFVIFTTAQPVQAAPPQWISGANRKEATWKFEKSLKIDEAVLGAELKLAADFCTAAVTINGQAVLTVEPYSQTQELDVTTYVRRGENTIRITASPVEGPAAVALSITFVGKEGKATTVVTDGSWPGAVSQGEVRAELWGLNRRSAKVSLFDNYEQWQQTKGTAPARQPQFWAVPGFEISLVRKAQSDEGSWIALAFDDQGRATISREDKGLLRMTLAADRGSVTRVEHIDAALPECRGLLYREGYLYANANEAKTMYRLKVTEEGRAVEMEKLREFPGGTGHGRNDLALGPNGLIYSIHGDSVQAPGQPVVDRTSPLRESRRGTPQQEAYVVRTDPQGKQWELFCTGLRNPYGLAFHPNGDLFTYDADNEYDMSTPWYRPTRIVQLVSGADYGYRVSKGKWPPNYPDHPDNGLPTIDVGRGSPTAVMFGTQLKYPTPYREALYVLDWTYGRVLAVHLAPRGAGYRGALELFLQGKPLNVTDLAAGPDGAMWLITGGRKTQSALYRVAFTAKETSQPSESEHERAAAKFAREQRALRAKLEAFHGREDTTAISQAWPHIANTDPLIRHAARIAIEQQAGKGLPAQYVEMLETKFTSERGVNVAARLEALMTTSRAGKAEYVPKLIDRLLELDTASLDLSARFTLLFPYRQALALAPDAVAKRREEIVGQLARLWPEPAKEGLRVSPFGDSLELRRRLALLLSDCGDPGIVERVSSSLLPSLRQEDKLQGLVALRNTRLGWTPDLRRAYFGTLREASKFVGGEGMPSFLDRLKTESRATLSEAEQAQLADLLSAPKIEEEPLPPARTKVKAWTLDDLTELSGENAPLGKAERGAKVFRDALCSRCHRAGLTGPAVGPDLTFVSRRFSRRDMLESILAPSRSVAENYRNVVVVSESGEVHVGRLIDAGDFRSEKLKLSVDPLHPGKVLEIDKKEIATQRLHDTSPMPQGLLDTFTCEEIADLLAFLEQSP